MEFSLKIIVIISVFIIGCSPKVKWGVYYGKEGSYIKLRSDGSFHVKNIRFTNDSFEAEDSRRKGGGHQAFGKYQWEQWEQWEEGNITFIFSRGREVRGKIRGDTLSVGRAKDQKFVIRK